MVGRSLHNANHNLVVAGPQIESLTNFHSRPSKEMSAEAQTGRPRLVDQALMIPAA